MARHVLLDERRPQLIDATIRIIAREGVAGLDRPLLGMHPTAVTRGPA